MRLSLCGVCLVDAPMDTYLSSHASDHGLAFQVTAFRQAFQHQEQESGSSMLSLKALWNYLLASWMSGVLRPAQVIQLLVYHQEQHPHVRLDAYTVLYSQLCRVCAGDIELQGMFGVRSISTLSNCADATNEEAGVDGTQWSPVHICQGLLPVEALAIKSLALYVTAETEHVLGNPSEKSIRTNFRVCMDSKISRWTAMYSPRMSSPGTSPSSSSSSLSSSHLKTVMHVSKSSLFRDAVCCVNPTAPSLFHSLWLWPWLWLWLWLCSLNDSSNLAHRRGGK